MNTHTHTTVHAAERSARIRATARHRKARLIARIIIDALEGDPITVERIPELPADVWSRILTIYRARYAPTTTGISAETRKLAASYYRQVEAEVRAERARVAPADPFAGVA